MGAGPLGVPSSNPGTSARAISQLREAVKIMQTALPELPVGSDAHTAVLNAVKSLSKHAAPSTEQPGQQQAELRNLQSTASRDAGIQQLMRSMGAGLAGAPGGTPPPGSTPGQPGAMPGGAPTPPPTGVG